MAILEPQTEGSVLVGAGISVAEPSRIPSWWDFNDLVLRELTYRVKDVLNLSGAMLAMVDSLTVDAVGVAHFSQIVHDTFAWGQWFRLLDVLDGKEPNLGHYALAALAAQGRVRTILTTNFDTLIERALEAFEVSHLVLSPHRDKPPSPLLHADRVVVVKLHGSVGEGTTMVDLAAQKLAGFSDAWKSWLRRTFESSPLTVAGFSGRDLELADDYLALFSAANRIPSLTWVTRDGAVGLTVVQQVLEQCGDRGRVVAGTLPEYFADQVRVTAPAMNPTEPPEHLSIPQWFDQVVHPMVLVSAVAFLLEETHGIDAAAEFNQIVRDTIMGRLVTSGLRSFTLPEVIATSHALAEIGRQGIHIDPHRALQDLGLVVQFDSFLHKLAALDESDPSWLSAYGLDRPDRLVGVFANIAMTATAADDVFLAEQALTLTRRLLQSVADDDERKWGLSALADMTDANLSMRRRQWRPAAVAYRSALTLFKKVGRDAMVRKATAGWRTAAIELGEPAVARIVSGSDVNEKGVTDVRLLLSRAAAEWDEANGRFDEVWYAATEVVGSDRASADLFVAAAKQLLVRQGEGALSSRILARATLVGFGVDDGEPVDLNADHIPMDVRHLLVHPNLLSSIDRIAVNHFNEGRALLYADPHGNAWPALQRFAVAARAFELCNRLDDAVWSKISWIDCYRAVSDLDRAQQVLDEVLEVVPQHLVTVAASMQVSITVDRAIATRVGMAEAERTVEHLRANSIPPGSDAATAARSHALLLKEMGRTEDGIALYAEAVGYLVGTDSEEKAREAFKEFVDSAHAPSSIEQDTP